jgi:cytochrome c biogenesis protein CcmG, thiol:disulfide interchange protein DsbE
VRRLVTGGAVAVLAALVALFGWQLLHGSAGRDFQAAVDAGKSPTAPAFSLPALSDGRDVTLASLRGRPVVVNFWASWCVDCKVEAPALQAIAARWRPRGVAFLGIDSNDFSVDARHFARRYGSAYPLLTDTANIDERYGVTGFPETFVIDPRGRAVAHFDGPVSADQVAQALRRAGAA